MKMVLNVIDRVDQRVFFAIFGIKTNGRNKYFSLLTKMGGLCFQTCLTLVLILLPSTKKLGILLGLIQLIVALNIQLLKRIVSRVRPYHAFAFIKPLTIERDFSFPSGHTAAAFSTAATLTAAAVAPIISFFYFIIVGLIGYYRIYLGVHYPTDVIVGGLIGLGLTKLLLLLPLG